jgi:hypothetical protein
VEKGKIPTLGSGRRKNPPLERERKENLESVTFE